MIQRSLHQMLTHPVDAFCDHHEVDFKVKCDDEHLWAVFEGNDIVSVLVGYVCANHVEAYRKVMNP